MPEDFYILTQKSRGNKILQDAERKIPNRECDRPERGSTVTVYENF